MKTQHIEDRIPTGVRNLDEVLFGGFLPGTLTVIAGTPGSGKTILSQQIAFTNASTKNRVLFFQTLSEPTAKTLRYLKQFTFFDPKKIEDGSIEFIDLGEIVRSTGLTETVALIMKHVKRAKPAIVIIDSFKAFDDLAESRQGFRKFSYEVMVNLMAWECTSLFLGEFKSEDLDTNPLFSIVDGIISLKHHAEAGEQQRYIQVLKMRGTNHSRDEQTFSITSSGIEVYAPRVTIRRMPQSDKMNSGQGPMRAKLGISQLDSLLGEGIPYGSSALISGTSGTGKTSLLLEFIFRGAREFGEKCIFFSFEETTERLISNARGMGWDIESEIKKGNIEIVFIPQTDIQVEKHLLMMKDRIEAHKAKRIAIDSVSIFLHKMTDPQMVREKIFQLGTIIQNVQGVGLFATDIPHGSNTISRFGVEETVVDGIILLTATEVGVKRERYIEIYKLRNTAHSSGRHKMKITKGGILICDDSPRHLPLQIANPSKHEKARK